MENRLALEPACFVVLDYFRLSRAVRNPIATWCRGPRVEAPARGHLIGCPGRQPDNGYRDPVSRREPTRGDRTTEIRSPTFHMARDVSSSPGSVSAVTTKRTTKTRNLVSALSVGTSPCGRLPQVPHMG